MSRGYGKYRGRGSSHHSSFHFDSLFKENANKPSAAKSAATVGKWGITSFTSIRTLNGRTGEDTSGSAETPKPKKFFKSRNSDSASDSAPYTSPPLNPSKVSAKRAKTTYEQVKEKPPPAKKFFSSKKTTRSASISSEKPLEKLVLRSSTCGNSKTAGGGDASKPPIVLRICHGKSQLVNDSDESERTPTPSSTPSTSSMTSPRALRESATRPSNCRITRSARRSMQSDPGSSPATADTPSEFIYTASSKKDDPVSNDLSPQYIPAEKYELERKAMYDSLLKPNSPKPEPLNVKSDMDAFKSDLDDVKSNVDNLKSGEPQGECEQDMDESGSIFEGDDKENETEEILPKPTKQEENEAEQEESIEAIQMEIIQGSKRIETDESTETVELQKQQENGDENEDSLDCEFDETLDDEPPPSVSAPLVPPLLVPPLRLVPPPPPPSSSAAEPDQSAKRSIDEDWSSDEDSNSTAPEMEVKQAQETDPKLNTIQRHKEQILDKILEKPPEPPPVKLVISKKKGSIFKSRALTQEDGSKKRTRARYVHKWIDDKEKAAGGETPARAAANNEPSELDFDFKGEPLSRLTKKVDEDTEVNTVKCAKSDKNYYMVVRNVKTSHQIQEIGEFQEFNDDVEYILDALQDNNPISTRCLSAITLASKCMAPAFRMHVRAHGVVAKFFKALHDATKDQSLGLCTATVMFVLSQDRLNMDLDRDCLELMLNLLESDVSYQQALDVCGLSTSQLEKNKEKVKELCAEIQSKGHAMHLNLENITTGQLAMETLLSLTSKRAGEWFKEELRELGGLEHIMKTIYECCKQVSDYVVTWTDVLLHKLKKVDRCLRVLENVTQNNEENQTYILKYNNGTMIDTLVSLYKLCDGEIPLYPITDISDKSSTGAIIREALLVTLKVLINLTHHFTNKQSIGSQLIGLRPGIIDTSLHLLLQVPNYIPEQKKFELGVLVLMLLINLIQDQDVNKKLLMAAKAPSKQERLYSREESAVEALIIQFYEWESCAKVAESKTDAILDGEKDGEEKEKKTTEEFIEETVAKLLQKAGTHMEYTFLASYIVMLVGFLIMENSEYQTNLRQFLRGGTFVDMVELLKKFYKFMNLTASTEASSVCAVKTTQRVIRFLEECDQPPEGTDVS